MIKLKTQQEIEILREGGKKLAAILKKVAKEAKPGVSTKYLDELAEKMIIEAGGRPAFKHYRPDKHSKPYPTTLCTSINNEVVHAPALPGRILKSGDIIGIDIGMEYPFSGNHKGLYTDMAVTVPVGKISAQAKKLLSVTKISLDIAINNIKPGMTINQLGGIIQDYVEKNGFSVVRQLVGHGVGFAPHEDPQVPNYRAGKHYDILLRPGMVIAVEPMVNVGGWEIETASDGNSVITMDGSLSAHFEHTLAITDKGCIIITAL